MGFLKDVATAFKPSNIARGLDAARNPPSQEEIEANLASLTPEQRAAYDANMARVEEGRAESEAAWHEAKEISDRNRVLWGPAGRYLYGAGMEEFGTPSEIEARIGEVGALTAINEMRAKRKGEFKQGVRQSFGVQEVKQIDDPGERVSVATAERAAREEARAPYRSPDAVPVAISRLATRGETQLAEVLAYLQSSGLSARPESVFGVYRVPDRISGPLTPHSERGRVVEWDVVHTPVEDAAAPGPPLAATSFVGEQQWVARRVGEPSILDEDLALAFCAEAGIGPERCVGLARMSEFRSLRGHGGDDSSGELRSVVTGVVAIHPEESSGTAERMRAAAPLELEAPQAGVHIEVLNWAEIGRAVHLKIHHPPPVPSPFPYLPATPQELLRAYLEVVGLQPSDCYSAQATVDHARMLVQGGFMTTNLGPKQPCADGKDRMRTHGCEQVVVVYRDTPEYAAGRERWKAYEWEVLQARLGHGLRLRPPVVADDDSDVPTKALRAAFRVAATIDRVAEWGMEKVPPYRYCWPPA